MRVLVLSLCWSVLLFGGIAAYSQLVANSRLLTHTNELLRRDAEAAAPLTPEAEAELVREARTRAARYEAEIEKSHLVDGMLVNLSGEGEMIDQCDSLLFSSLRYVSLAKLGMTAAAQAAWSAIERSQDNGRWLRHPRCTRATSRDMILGLLVAMSQEPPGFSQHLAALMQLVEHNDGFFGSGPIYVSYLSPGLARMMALLAPRGRLAPSSLPEIVRAGYSTAELEVLVTGQGFESHLGALTAWMELELTDKVAPGPRSIGMVAGLLDRLVQPFAAESLSGQRLAWITGQLIENDPDNLFFRYLRLRAAGALTHTVQLQLLQELLAMPHFPKDRLPMSCDRVADYLWQRADRQAKGPPAKCSEEFHGTDFLWMTALLLEPRGPAAGMPAH